ncbi:MAG: GPP34 family phosphoprotein [Anaerolineales bacterium]|nr:GPP34 family phosphoprotein [Anaerolineales bacterium]
MFTLPEELLLLSIHEAKGTFLGGASDRLKTGLGGAILAELALAGKICATNNHRVQLTEDGEVQDEVLNKILGVLKEAEKERKFGYWINALSQRTEKLQGKIIESLIQKGVFTQDEERLVWVIPSPLQPDIKASTKFLVNKRLRGIVLAQDEFETRDLVLLSLVRACNLLDGVFLRDERKLADRYVNERLFSQAITDPVMQTVQEIAAAIATVVEED